MKRILAILLIVVMTTAMFACKTAEEPKEPVRVAALAGPTGVGLAYLMQDQAEQYDVSIFNAPDQITAKIINGEVDIAAVPINLASVLYKKTEGEIVTVAVNTLGVLYVLENGESVSNIADLAGKTIYSTGQGSTPQYILENVLAANGLTDSVKVEYLADNTELIAKLAEGSVEVAVLPEPHVSIAMAKSENIRVALSMNDIWAEANRNDIVQGVYVVRKAFLSEHSAAVDAFLADAKESKNRALTEADAPSVVVAQGILGAEGIAKKAIPNCNLVLLTDEEMRSAVKAMLQTLFEANPASVGGALPSDDFYYVCES